MKYVDMSPPCDLTASSLGWAATKCGPSFIYDLYIHESNIGWVKRMLKEIGAETKENPFAPYVNIRVDNDLTTYEWYLSANSFSWGSKGA